MIDHLAHLHQRCVARDEAVVLGVFLALQQNAHRHGAQARAIGAVVEADGRKPLEDAAAGEDAGEGFVGVNRELGDAGLVDAVEDLLERTGVIFLRDRARSQSPQSGVTEAQKATGPIVLVIQLADPSNFKICIPPRWG